MAYSTSYARDERLLKSGRDYATAILIAAGLIIFPLTAPGYWVYFAGLLGINIIATHGLNIITGYTGLLSLGHAAFMGVGAYTVAITAEKLGFPFYLTLPLAGVMAAIIGVGFGLPSLRIRGLYLVIATLAAQFILHFTFVEWESLTKGDIGYIVKPIEIFGVKLDNERNIYFLILPIVVLMTLFAHNLFRTRVGRAFIAIRERDLTAEVLGVHLVKYKLMSFAIGSFYAGVAGGLMAYFFRLVNPEAVRPAAFRVLPRQCHRGRMGSTLGSILGAFFMTILPEILRLSVESLGKAYQIDLTTVLVPIRETIFGLMMILFLIFAPHGLVQLWQRTRAMIATWPFRN